MSRAVFVCTLLSLVPLSAQEDAPLVDLSGGLRIECAGPELIRRLLLPTDLGSLLTARGGPEFDEAAAVVIGELLGSLSGPLRLDEPFERRLAEQLVDYRGRCVCAFDVTISEEGHWESVDGVLVLSQDGHTDLSALRRTLIEGLGLGSDEEDGRQIAWIQMWPGKFSRDAGITLPVEVDGGLVVVFAKPIKEALRRRLPEGARLDLGEAMRSDCFEIRVGTGMLRAWINRSAEEEVEQVRAALGLDAVDELRLRIGASGPRVRAELSATFVPEVDRGLVGAFCRETAGMSGLFGLLPEGSATWFAGRVSLKQMYEAFFEMLGPMIAGAGPVGPEEARAVMAKRIGFDIADDLLAHVGEEFLFTGSYFGREEDPTTAEASGRGRGGAAQVFRLVDAEAFEATWRRLLDRNQFGPVFEEEEIGGVILHAATNGEMAWVVADDLVIVAESESAEAGDVAGAMLNRLEKLRNVEAKLPVAIERLRRDAPATLQGVGQIEIRELLSRRAMWWFELDQLLHPALLKRTAELGAMVEGHELQRAVLFQGWEESRWTLRLLW